MTGSTSHHKTMLELLGLKKESFAGKGITAVWMDEADNLPVPKPTPAETERSARLASYKERALF